MVNKFRSLVASGNEEFRAELIERAIGLNFTVQAVKSADELPEVLREQDFDWFMLDTGLGVEQSRRIIAALATGRRPRTILVGNDNSETLDLIRRSALRAGLDVVGMLGRPLSSATLSTLLNSLGAKESNASEAGLSARRLEAIPNDEVVVHYQPIVAMPGRTIGRVEALVRWQHPHYGLIRPERFIGLAEKSGAIVPLTWEVLARSIDQHLAWRAEGYSLSVSVNISVLVLTSLEVADRILAMLRERNCDPQALMLEITETERAPAPAVARGVLEKVRAAGVAISMDDYGVGFSNLERLHYYPFTDLKIDRGLVAGLGGNWETRGTVAMLTALASREGFTLTGEGIETTAQWDALEQMGCNFGQGFLIARPMEADDLVGWMEKAVEAGEYRLARTD
jgi:EAL domain-containing protein (putative c-di-GMP-specific phosphodiesterase class I)